MLNNQCCEGLRRREEVRGTLRETGLFLGESMLLGLKTRSDITKLYSESYFQVCLSGDCVPPQGRRLGGPLQLHTSPRGCEKTLQTTVTRVILVSLSCHLAEIV